MDFKEFYLKRNVLLEMPQKITTKLDQDKSAQIVRETYKHIGNIKIDNTDLEIYAFHTKEISLVFLNNDDIVVEVNFKKLNNGGIEETFVIQHPNYKGFARKIYGEYLLKNYKFILSDSTMTQDGLNFWKKLFIEYNTSVAFYIITPDNKLRIRNTEQMDDVFGKQKQFHRIRFLMVQKNNKN